jgi:hypothetical protein
MKLITRPIKWSVVPDGSPLFAESATEIEIVDEAAGEFVEISQSMEGYGKIGIEPSDWPTLRAAIDAAVKQCKEWKP